MASANPRQALFASVPFLLGLASVLISGWMIVTLPSGGSLEAGWRHELICSVLAAFAIYATTWGQGRPWPQPAAMVATCALVLELAVLVLPVPRLPALAIASAVIAVAAVAAIPFEVRGAREASPALEAIVVVGLADIAAITPVFFWLALDGTLR